MYLKLTDNDVPDRWNEEQSPDPVVTMVLTLLTKQIIAFYYTHTHTHKTGWAGMRNFLSGITYAHGEMQNASYHYQLMKKKGTQCNSVNCTSNSIQW